MKKKEIRYAPQLIGDLLDIIHNAILVIDSNKQIIFVNSRTAKMFNTTTSKLRGLKVTELFMPEDTDILVANILSIIHQDGEYEGEAMFKRDDGSTFLGLIAGTFFKWDNKQDGIAFTIHDLSAIKSIEQSLKRSERIAFLGRLIDDINHQIRNPVMVIGGFARRLAADAKNGQKAQAILKEARHLETLLDTLGKFIKLPRPSPKRIPLHTIIQVTEKQLQQTVKELGCTWINKCDNTVTDTTLLLDQDLLIEALQSVVTNACESYDKTAIEKPVIFQVKQSDDPKRPYTISITDHGVGIPEDRTGDVFSHFYSNKTKHIGMGLTFARRITEEQMGEISIESAPQKGTTVTFHLVRERRRVIRTTQLDDNR
jgi:PAS domain S-box-containing protein